MKNKELVSKIELLERENEQLHIAIRIQKETIHKANESKCMDIKNTESILKRADEVVNNRSEEKERRYGPFSEGMERAAKIASGMTGKDLVAEDIYAVLVALKLSRHSYNYREDNLLDAVAYLGGLDNYIKGKNNEDS